MSVVSPWVVALPARIPGNSEVTSRKRGSSILQGVKKGLAGRPRRPHRSPCRAPRATAQFPWGRERTSGGGAPQGEQLDRAASRKGTLLRSDNRVGYQNWARN